MVLGLKGTFKGGVHPTGHKGLSCIKEIAQSSLPDIVILPVNQHIGADAVPIVEKGDDVIAGQIVAEEAKDRVSSRIIASVSGKVSAIEEKLTPTGKHVLSIVIKTDKENKEVKTMPGLDNPNREEIIERVKEAGIVGLGGAAFPTDIKLQPNKEHKVEKVIANGCECEPYLTSDHRQMIEYADDLIDGMKLVMKVLGAPEAVIAIEDNKKDAIDYLNSKTQNEESISIMPLKTKYPQGAADMLIKTIIGKEVPSGGRSTSTGGFIQNVATLISISRAVRIGEPLISRVVTVTGDLVKDPKNIKVPIGTPISHLINEAGGLTGDKGIVIVGGPMTGSAQFCFDAPILKATGGVIAMSAQEQDGSHLQACIRCSRCVSACPMGLMPSTLSIYSEVQMWEKTLEFKAQDCIECSCCSYVCPSKRPIAQMIKFAKEKIWQMEEGK